MKKIIVACAGAVATSTVAANKIMELCKANGIAVEICQVRLSEIASYTKDASLLVTTARIKQDYGIAYVEGLPFITGIGIEETKAKILRILQEP